MDWDRPDWNSHEESKDAWKILKHHTEVASDRIYEELPEILQHSFDEGVAYAREQIAMEALALLQHSGDDGCTCPKYPDGETWDGHMCFKFQLLDLITKDERVSDRIDKENKNV